MPGQWVVQASSEAWPEAGAQAERSLNTGWILDNSGFSSTGGVNDSLSPSTAVAFLSTGDGTTGSGNGYYALGRLIRVVHGGGTAYGYVTAASVASGQTTVTIGGFTPGGTTSLSTASIDTVAAAYPFPGVTGNMTEPQPYNYLVNPGFEVWQRGTGAFTALAAFTADRWQIFDLGSTGGASVSRSASTEVDSQYAMTAQATSTGGAAVKFAQKIADEDSSVIRMLRGRLLTFACRVAGTTGWHVGYKTSTGTGAWTSTGTSHSATTTYETLSVTFTLSTAATQLWVGVGTDTATTGHIDNATLCVWPTPVRYQPLAAAEEWERCQRYYEVRPATYDSNGRFEVQSSASSSHYISQPVTFMTRKAAEPTLTKNGTWNVSNCSQPDARTGSVDMCQVGATASAAGPMYFNSSTGSMYITAESNP